MNSKVIRVDELARVEGEGGLHIKIAEGRVADVKVRIPEPPRFFEAFLRGRKYTEVPDITARICGICPVAYQMSAVHAIEDAFGVLVEGSSALSGDSCTAGSILRVTFCTLPCSTRLISCTLMMPSPWPASTRTWSVTHWP